MAALCGYSSLEKSEKFTNYSARNITVRKLKNANIEHSDIVKVTEAYNPSTTTMKSMRKSKDGSLLQYPNEIIKTPVPRRSE